MYCVIQKNALQYYSFLFFLFNNDMHYCRWVDLLLSTQLHGTNLATVALLISVGSLTLESYSLSLAITTPSLGSS
jgi:hypothetical protein